MPIRIVEGKLPYTGGTGIGIDTNKVISLLLREENNLIHVNDDNEVYTDLQLVANITPSSDFPVGVTVGKVLQTDGWTQNGLLLNRKTTSGDYARWLYGADGELYFDGGQGTWKQVYYSDEVLALFTQLRGELATVAFSGDYNDLINRPAFLQEQADWDQTDTDAPDYIKNKPTIPTVNDAILTIQKNGASVGTFTANASTNTAVNITVPNVINNVQSTSTSDALSANQGKVLQDQIDDLKAMGRFLSLWDCETGQPISFPLATPYNYQTGDYFLVENVDTTTNYRPNGVQYTGTASTTVETDEVEVGDLYIYDGAVWLLQINHGKSVSFANLAGQPSDNTALATALNSKADATDVNVKVFVCPDPMDDQQGAIDAVQGAVDYIAQGKTALIRCSANIDNGLYALESQSSTQIVFRFVNKFLGAGAVSYEYKDKITGVLNNGTVTAVAETEERINFLETDRNYNSTYTPQYNGSPATKKYVDDNKVTATSQLNNDSGYITSAYHDSSKQDAMTLPSTPTQGDLVLWGANNTTLVDGGKGVKVFDLPQANDDITDIVNAVSGGRDVILKEVSGTSTIYWRVTSDAYYSSSSRRLSATALFYGVPMSASSYLITYNTSTKVCITVNSSNGTFFYPTNAGSTGQVLTKTSTNYEWAAPSGGDVMVSSQSGNILTSGMKIWAGTQANYESLGTYDNNTVYLTI